jgi:NAD-dependent SIR2 family protein deacetylase
MRSSPQPGSDKYRQQHNAVYKARGKAKDQKCVDCGKQAREWSTVHGTDGSDPHAHYEPRCVKCHSQYDNKSEVISKAQRGTKRSAESNEKRSKTLTGRTLSEEHRRKIAESRKGFKESTPRSDEYRAKMSAAQKGRQFSDEHRQALRDRMATDEYKQRQSEAQKKAWARRRAADGDSSSNGQ